MAESTTMQQQSAPKNTSGKSVWIEQPVPLQMSRTYFYQDGTTVTKKNGTVSWRNNNEGNLRPGSLSSTRIGVDQKNFAVFATPEDGRAAKQHLLFSSSSYKDLTLKKAIARYAPSSDNNNPTSYANFVMKNGNVADKVMSTYTADEQERILQAMKRQEGYKEGETIKGTANNAALKNVIAQSASNNAVASAKPAEKSGAAAQGGRQMNAEGHPIYYPKGAKETQEIINWNKGRNYTEDYIKAFQKVIETKDDGGIGTNTVNAIRHYQEKNGLGQDGKWGKECADHAKLPRKYNSGSASGGAGGGSSATPSGAGINPAPTFYKQGGFKESPYVRKDHYNQMKQKMGSTPYAQWKISDPKIKQIYATAKKINGGNSTISSSGCGATAFGNLKGMTPTAAAEVAMEAGGRYYGGTYPEFFEKKGGAATGWGKENAEKALAAVAQGKYLICSMNNNNNNYWTKGGHFILVYGYDGTYVYVSDSGSSAAHRQKARKNMFTTAYKYGYLFTK